MIIIEFSNLWDDVLIIISCFYYVMPESSDRSTRTKSVAIGINGIKGRSTKSRSNNQEDHFLTIAPALPILPGAPVPPKLSKRCYNSFSLADSPFNIEHDKVEGSNTVTLQWSSEGKNIVATRTAAEKEKNPDRICLDRRGLTTFPNIVGEPRLRLLSLQHNLLTKIENSNFSKLTKLVFLDLYDNQIERICNFELLENLRVLLIGKNRIKKIEGLKSLSKLEVLDLHGNQIVQISDLNNLVSLKVLNLAGNNIKVIGYNDFQGLTALKELNLRRNKIKRLLAFDETPQLQKLYLSNNDIHKIEDIGSLAKALQLREITIDGNPVTLTGDYVSFLVSYLPHLQLLSTMPITEQTRRAAMAWRTTKEQSNSTFLNLTAQVCMNVRREEIISNAKTNWEFLRCHTKSSTDKSNNENNVRPNMLKIQKSNKFNMLRPQNLEKVKAKDFGSLTSINENIEATKINIKKRSNSSDNLFRLKDTTKTYPLEFKLPPILGSIVDNLINTKFDDKIIISNENLTKARTGNDTDSTASSDSEIFKCHENFKSCLKPHMIDSVNHISQNNIDKFLTNEIDPADLLSSALEIAADINENENCTLFKSSPLSINEKQISKFHNQHIMSDCQSKSSIGSSGYCSLSSKTNSMDSCKSVLSDSSTSSVARSVLQKHKTLEKDRNRVKSAQIKKVVYYKSNRAATARAKYRAIAPPNPTPVQNLSKEREQGGDYLIEIVGRCLNIYGQGALRFIDRPWDSSKAEDVNITNAEVDFANKEYAGLVDIVMCSLPESLLQPLLQRLQLEKVQKQNGEQITAKQFLLNSDPALRSVVAKEALQWRKGSITQEDLIWRHKGKIHLLNLINLTVDAIQKLQLLENTWPSILYEIIHSTLSDFSDMDTYMKRCFKTLEDDK
ncbi:uncharacterized protein LOC100881268 isoform X4 [Megachile rotundata]|uniref:uncharacterized protein LOC100881268 isoform X4 n=1 Tax=Megachile rotundata TaxID=143995 RepID=UPI0006152439|nr:PREDICTED: uncharacterized protein LOC100881268 isoform X4 [Megachile rotundata]